MGREDQIEEREVLDSIFPDEIIDISETSYKISIPLDPPDGSSEPEEQPVIFLEVSYPETYPDVAPELQISAPPNAPKHPLLELPQDDDVLLSALESTIEENLGMAMVFSLVSALKEAGENLMSERVKAEEEKKAQVARKAEEEENRKFQGTPVNRETFEAWLSQFQKEIQEEEQRQIEEKEAEDKKKKTAKEEKKLTGRQLWERGLAGKGDDDEEGEDAMPAVEKLKVAA
ncbi:hypothetical protein N7462_007678 [Penicillium macrosclerotiorum]|uniref:uncharacterized protein n=1 Tax=Penicillium macrosclerotiorum TaxID=303699 RepID=UPI0025484FFE|nr:uncharacterized protein N7462_007678 [Penicillium macrosclerotiorum]KAJ5679434.1 hypothetical protein N7462_007678 [Penicillium macrosclerotiorum]